MPKRIGTHVEKGRIGQGDAGAAQIVARMKHELIDAGGHFPARQQRRVAAAVGIGRHRLDRLELRSLAHDTA